MSGKRSRRKGHQFERDVAIQFRLHGYPEARRHLEYQDAEANGIDLVHTGRYKVQCKKFKQYAPITAINEVKCDPVFGDVPVLITAGDNLPPMAVLPLSEFLHLVRRK